MADFIAVKKLGGTDLGWFKSLYHRFSNSNLKGINFNSDVLIDEFYRDLAVIAANNRGRLPVNVTMFGPAAASGYPGIYKLVKSPGSKNWRLNGTLVGDPIGEDHRFDMLQRDDIAVVAFDGRPAPTEILLFLLAAADPVDAPLHAALAQMVAGTRRTMVAIDAATVQRVVDVSRVRADHPIRLLLADDEIEAALEDAVQGGIRGTRRLQRIRSRRIVTSADIELANREMTRVGAEGEALVDTHLSKLRQAGNIDQYRWTSQTDPYSPYDFEYTAGSAIINYIDVKSTKRGFNEDFHMSMGEVLFAAESECPYFIYRIHGLTDSGCNLSVSSDIRAFARKLRAAHDSIMPGKVTADSFSVPMDTPDIHWDKAITVTAPEVDDEG